MKKRLILSLALLLGILLISGCSSDKKANDDGLASGDGADVSSVPSVTIPAGDTQTTETSEELSLLSGAEESDLFIDNLNNNTVTFLNPDGSLYKMVDISKVIRENFGSWLNISYGGSYGHKIYIANSRSDDQSLWEYDIDTEKAERIYIGLVQNPVVSIDEDVILLDNTTYLNEGGKVYSSSRLTRDSSGRWQDEEICNNINELCNSENGLYPLRTEGNAEHFSPAYCLANYGMAVYTKDASLYVYDENGALLNTLTADDGCKYCLKAMTSDCLIYSVMGKDYHERGLYAYDLTSNEERTLYSEQEGEELSVLDMDGETCYVAIVSNPEYCHSITDIRAININDCSMEDVATVETVPGRHEIDMPALYSFKIMGNTAVYGGETENATGLLCSVKSDSEWVQKDIDIPFYEYDYSKYANIKSMNYSVQCPYCDNTAYEWYYEYPEIKASVPNADKINETLSAIAGQTYKEAKSYEADYTEEDCRESYHGQYGIFTDESLAFVIGVDEVFDRYLVIYNMSFDMRMLAAHGFDRTYCRIFDLESGDEVDMSDIYKGSEEEFRKIVAEAAVEKYESDSDFAESVFATDSEEFYENAYGSAAPDWDSFTFYDDYLTINFDPYILGPFSSGEISVPVSYDKLGLR